jgi:hypothetical protein
MMGRSVRPSCDQGLADIGSICPIWHLAGCHDSPEGRVHKLTGGPRFIHGGAIHRARAL